MGGVGALMMIAGALLLISPVASRANIAGTFSGVSRALRHAFDVPADEDESAAHLLEKLK